MISIIIPCYNVEKYIKKCLDSLLTQEDVKNLEIICVNDGSADGTSGILEEYAKADSRISVISQQNAGLSAARNTGIGAASGSSIMFVDADDWVERSALSKTRVYAEKYDLVCFSYQRIFKDQIKPRKLNLHGEYSAAFIQRRIVGLSDDELSDPSQANSLVTAWGKIYRTEIIRKNNLKFTDTQLIGTEDALFNIEYLECSENVFILDLPLYNYQKISDGSLTQSYKKDLLFQWETLYERIGDVIRNKDVVYQKALNNRISLGIIGLGLNEIYSNENLPTQYRKLRNILSDEKYRQAISGLEYTVLPLQWKIFFIFAKKRMTLPLLGMLYYMKSQLK